MLLLPNYWLSYYRKPAVARYIPPRILLLPARSEVPSLRKQASSIFRDQSGVRSCERELLCGAVNRLWNIMGNSGAHKSITMPEWLDTPPELLAGSHIFHRIPVFRFTSRSRSRLKIFPEKSVIDFQIKIDPRFSFVNRSSFFFLKPDRDWEYVSGSLSQTERKIDPRFYCENRSAIFVHKAIPDFHFETGSRFSDYNRDHDCDQKPDPDWSRSDFRT